MIGSDWHAVSVLPATWCEARPWVTPHRPEVQPAKEAELVQHLQASVPHGAVLQAQQLQLQVVRERRTGAGALTPQQRTTQQRITQDPEPAMQQPGRAAKRLQQRQRRLAALWPGRGRQGVAPARQPNHRSKAASHQARRGAE
jgi:hypothetical protein